MKKPQIDISLLADSGRQRLAQRAAVLLVCLISFALAFLCMKRFGFYSTDYSPDEGHYIDMARRLLSDHVYSYWGEGPDAYTPYGYPVFLAVGMAIFGSDLNGLLCLKIVHCVLIAATVLLTYLLGKMLTGKFSVGFIACFLIAFNPSYYFYGTKLLTEPLYFFYMLLFFLTFLWANQGDKPWRYTLSGALFALAMMVRPLIVVILPFVFLPSLVRNWKKWRAFLTPLLLFLAGFVAVCLPWWIRNLVTLHQFIPLATQTNPIYAGLSPALSGLPESIYAGPAPDLTGLADPGSFSGNLKLMLQLFLDDPIGMTYWMTFGKFYIIFMQDVGTQFNALVTFIWNVNVYVGLFGALRALFTRRWWGLALVFWVYLAASFLFVPVIRYALQYLPFMAIFAGDLLVCAFTHRDEPLSQL